MGKIYEKETIACPYCGELNIKGRDYCWKCHRPLRPIAKPIT